MLLPGHHGPGYPDVPLNEVQFPHNMPPILSTTNAAKILIGVGAHVVLQNPRQAGLMPDTNKWVVAKREEIQSRAGKNDIRWTSPFVREGVAAIATIFVSI